MNICLHKPYRRMSKDKHEFERPRYMVVAILLTSGYKYVRQTKQLPAGWGAAAGAGPAAVGHGARRSSEIYMYIYIYIYIHIKHTYYVCVPLSLSLYIYIYICLGSYSVRPEVHAAIRVHLFVLCCYVVCWWLLVFVVRRIRASARKFPQRSGCTSAIFCLS